MHSTDACGWLLSSMVVVNTPSLIECKAGVMLVGLPCEDYLFYLKCHNECPSGAGPVGEHNYRTMKRNFLNPLLFLVWSACADGTAAGVGGTSFLAAAPSVIESTMKLEGKEGKWMGETIASNAYMEQKGDSAVKLFE